MNKIELLKEMRSLYGTTCSADVLKANLDAYNKIIKGNLNYDKLYELIISQWKYGNYMPTPGFIQEQISEAIIKSKKKKQKKYIYDCLMLEDFEKFGIKKGEIGSGNREEVISLHNSGVKFKVFNKTQI